MQTILVPTDFSTHSEKAIELAVKLAKLSGGSIHLLHCYQLHPGGISPYGITAPAEFDEKIRAAAAESLAAVEQRLAGEGVSVKTHITPSYPSEAVSELAAEIGADVIVMGTRGATGLQHILLGSVAERTLRIAPCPVLTVKDTDR
jgi:nucleotide-binding universal stress UspA family protein